MGSVTPDVFVFSSFEVRTHVDLNKGPIFCARDVCDVLGHSNSRSALSRLDVEEKVYVTVLTSGGPQVFSFITEFGLCHLILTSRKPIAKHFRRWVASQVLPGLIGKWRFLIFESGVVRDVS